MPSTRSWTFRAMTHPPLSRRSRIGALIVASLLLVAPTLAQEPLKPKELKVSTAVGPAFALGKAGELWSKLVAEKSQGKLAARLFPGATLAQRDPTREFVALRDGAADLAVGSTLFWSLEVKELAWVGLPWLAPDDRDIEMLTGDAFAPRLFSAIERAGAVPLAVAALGHREIATTKPLRMPPDFKGLKVRTISHPQMMDLYAGLGAEPRSMTFVEAQAALQGGTLDAQGDRPATIAAAHLDALGLKQLLLWGATAEIAVFAANRTAWSGWSDDERLLVQAAAQEAARELPALARAENETAIAELRKRGVTLTRLTPTGRAAFAAAARGVYEKWASVAGADVVSAAESAIKASGAK